MLSKKRKGRKNKDAPADLPVLLISGKDDPVGDMGRGVERLAKYYKGIGVKNVSVHLIEGSRHEFLCGRGAPRGRACGDRGVYKADLRAEKMSLDPQKI